MLPIPSFHRISLAVFSKKTLAILILAFPLTAIIKFIQTYIFNDWPFLISLIILITIDSILGATNAWKKHSLSSKGFGQVAIKLLVYCSLLITVHVLTGFTIDGSHPATFQFINDFSVSTLIIREAISIFENISLLMPGLVPDFILKRLQAFDTNTGKPLAEVKEETKS